MDAAADAITIQAEILSAADECTRQGQKGLCAQSRPRAFQAACDDSAARVKNCRHGDIASQLWPASAVRSAFNRRLSASIGGIFSIAARNSASLTVAER
jgi:hypothetical protein